MIDLIEQASDESGGLVFIFGARCCFQCGEFPLKFTFLWVAAKRRSWM